MNVADLLRAAAAGAPDKTALVHGAASTITYAQMDAEADRVAGGLVALGVRPGDRVAVAMPNVVAFPIAYFATLRAGAVVVPVNVMLTENEVGGILADSGARVLLGAGPAAAIAARAAEAIASVEHVVAEGDWERLSAQAAPVDRAHDDVAVLSYTSGTTGRPKGAMLTHGNLLANLEQQAAPAELRITSDDVLLLALPLFHIFGLNVTLGQMVRAVASGVLVDRFEPAGVLEAIQRHGVTVVVGVPTMYKAWADVEDADRYDLARVRLAVSGAAPLPPEVLDAFRRRFGVDVYEGYGLTETAPTLTSNRAPGGPRPGSVGRPLPGVEIRLVDDAGNEVERGDPGEVLVRGPNVFKGYWGRDEETERAFVDGWFRTGDVAVEDEDGYMYLVDRKRDLIIVSGFNVFPSEVEAALTEHPLISEAAVVGVPHPRTGEAVKAFVVLAQGAEVTEADITAFLRDRLARFKCPDSVAFVDELPRVLAGKVARRALRT